VFLFRPHKKKEKQRQLLRVSIIDLVYFEKFDHPIWICNVLSFLKKHKNSKSVANQTLNSLLSRSFYDNFKKMSKNVYKELKSKTISIFRTNYANFKTPLTCHHFS
jgi:hypothetical protein